eukprot:TCONS_00073788-protein
MLQLEKIASMRMDKNGQLQFEVHWKPCWLSYNECIHYCGVKVTESFLQQYSSMEPDSKGKQILVKNSLLQNPKQPPTTSNKQKSFGSPVHSSLVSSTQPLLAKSAVTASSKQASPHSKQPKQALQASPKTQSVNPPKSQQTEPPKLKHFDPHNPIQNPINAGPPPLMPSPTVKKSLVGNPKQMMTIKTPVKISTENRDLAKSPRTLLKAIELSTEGLKHLLTTTVQNQARTVSNTNILKMAQNLSPANTKQMLPSINQLLSSPHTRTSMSKTVIVSKPPQKAGNKQPTTPSNAQSSPMQKTTSQNPPTPNRKVGQQSLISSRLSDTASPKQLSFASPQHHSIKPSTPSHQQRAQQYTPSPNVNSQSPLNLYLSSSPAYLPPKANTSETPNIKPPQGRNDKAPTHYVDRKRPNANVNSPLITGQKEMTSPASKQHSPLIKASPLQQMSASGGHPLNSSFRVLDLLNQQKSPKQKTPPVKQYNQQIKIPTDALKLLNENSKTTQNTESPHVKGLPRETSKQKGALVKPGGKQQDLNSTTKLSDQHLLYTDSSPLRQSPSMKTTLQRTERKETTNSPSFKPKDPSQVKKISAKLQVQTTMGDSQTSSLKPSEEKTSPVLSEHSYSLASPQKIEEADPKKTEHDVDFAISPSSKLNKSNERPNTKERRTPVVQTNDAPQVKEKEEMNKKSISTPPLHPRLRMLNRMKTSSPSTTESASSTPPSSNDAPPATTTTTTASAITTPSATPPAITTPTATTTDSTTAQRTAKTTKTTKSSTKKKITSKSVQNSPIPSKTQQQGVQSSIKKPKDTSNSQTNDLKNHQTENNSLKDMKNTVYKGSIDASTLPNTPLTDNLPPSSSVAQPIKSLETTTMQQDDSSGTFNNTPNKSDSSQPFETQQGMKSISKGNITVNPPRRSWSPMLKPNHSLLDETSMESPFFKGSPLPPLPGIDELLEDGTPLKVSSEGDEKIPSLKGKGKKKQGLSMKLMKLNQRGVENESKESHEATNGETELEKKPELPMHPSKRRHFLSKMNQQTPNVDIKKDLVGSAVKPGEVVKNEVKKIVNNTSQSYGQTTKNEVGQINEVTTRKNIKKSKNVKKPKEPICSPKRKQDIADNKMEKKSPSKRKTVDDLDASKYPKRKRSNHTYYDDWSPTDLLDVEKAINLSLAEEASNQPNEKDLRLSTQDEAHEEQTRGPLNHSEQKAKTVRSRGRPRSRKKESCSTPSPQSNETERNSLSDESPTLKDTKEKYENISTRRTGRRNSLSNEAFNVEDANKETKPLPKDIATKRIGRRSSNASPETDQPSKSVTDKPVDESLALHPIKKRRGRKPKQSVEKNEQNASLIENHPQTKLPNSTVSNQPKLPTQEEIYQPDSLRPRRKAKTHNPCITSSSPEQKTEQISKIPDASPRLQFKRNRKSSADGEKQTSARLGEPNASGTPKPGPKSSTDETFEEPLDTQQTTSTSKRSQRKSRRVGFYDESFNMEGDGSSKETSPDLLSPTSLHQKEINSTVTKTASENSVEYNLSEQSNSDIVQSGVAKPPINQSQDIDPSNNQSGQMVISQDQWDELFSDTEEENEPQEEMVESSKEKTSRDVDDVFTENATESSTVTTTKNNNHEDEQASNLKKRPAGGRHQSCFRAVSLLVDSLSSEQNVYNFDFSTRSMRKRSTSSSNEEQGSPSRDLGLTSQKAPSVSRDVISTNQKASKNNKTNFIVSINALETLDVLMKKVMERNLKLKL